MTPGGNDDEHTRLSAAGEIAAVIFHDLRSPLSIIKGYIDMLALKETDVPKEKLKEISTAIALQIDIINEMSMDAACFRGESKPVLRSIPLDLIMTSLRSGFPAEVTIDVQGAENVIVDTSIIERALANIVRVLSSAAECGPVAIDAHAAGALTVTIRAKCPHLPEASFAKIFTPMFVYGRRRGAGLALMCAKKLILDHGGTISAAQDNGRFTVTVVIPQ